MINLELSSKEADLLDDLLINAVTVRASKAIKWIAKAEEMTPKEVRQMLARIALRLKERPGEAKLVRFLEVER